MESKLKISNMDLTEKPLFGKMILFTLPLIATGILQLLYNATDIIVLGHFASDNSAGAVGSTGALINLITNLFIGLSVGSSTIAAKYIGAKDFEKVDKAVHTSILLALICGVVISIFAIPLTKYFLIAMNVPENILPLSTLYLQIYFAGLPFSFLYNFGSALLRAQGDTRHPLIFLFSAGVINVILNLVLVIVCKMDVAGVGIATVIAQFISALLVIVYLIKQKGICKLYLKKLRIDTKSLKEIIKIGLPAGLEGSIFAISNVIIQSAINSFGDLVITANADAWNLEGFVYISMNAVSQACLTFTGQNYGANKPENIDRTRLNSLILSVSIGLTMGLSIYFASDFLMKIYTTNPEVIALAHERFQIVCTVYFLCGIMDVLGNNMRGMGHSFTPMILSLLGACVFRIIYIYTVFQFYHETFVLYLAYPISWILTILLQSISLFFVRKKEFASMKNPQQPNY